jgi:6-hydroxycyclohex-1-ene-1-carbonyl-CoA dehydrogenase
MTEIVGWQMREPGAPLEAVIRPVPPLAPDEVLVRVAGCGLCHTDVGFLHEGVRTRRPPPLILGHEVSGIVEDAGSGAGALVGKAVVVPAVIPCGDCALCRSGRSTICPRQIMPGNDADGGFASHIVLPSRGVCPIPGASGAASDPIGTVPGLTLRHLAVVADAVSTAYQAVARSGLSAGSLALVVGLGGVGTYAAQAAAAAGAAVVGLDVDARRLATASALGAGLALDPGQIPAKELKARVSDFARSRGAAETGWVILECSGSPAGQTTAWSLLGPGATLVVVGFTREAVTLRLSNLMAFDARALGNWGCAPELYPEILEKVLAGAIDVVSHTEVRPLSGLAAAIEDLRAHRAAKRVVLAPENGGGRA